MNTLSRFLVTCFIYFYSHKNLEYKRTSLSLSLSLLLVNFIHHVIFDHSRYSFYFNSVLTPLKFILPVNFESFFHRKLISKLLLSLRSVYRWKPSHEMCLPFRSIWCVFTPHLPYEYLVGIPGSQTSSHPFFLSPSSVSLWTTSLVLSKTFR